MRGIVLEGFAGPGGASEGMRQLGIEAIGVEWDAAACATRRAAGHLTIRADVASLPLEHLAGQVGGVWLSPPCPTFSSAGKGEGRDEMPYLLSFLERVYRTGKWHDPWAWHQWSDPRTPLILEPVRWALTLNPEWMVCEQVPAGLPIWESIAAILEDHGYSCWAGVLNTADLGVPQTRQRAMLMASRVRTVHPPEPTHAREPVQSLFGPELLPWVSMADALGWTADVEMVQRRGAGMIERHGERPGRPMDEPAFTLGAGTQRQKELRPRMDSVADAGGAMDIAVGGGVLQVDSSDLIEPQRDGDGAVAIEGEAVDAGLGVGHADTVSRPLGAQKRLLLRVGAQANATERALDEPAPTLTSSLDNGDTRWVVRTGTNTMKHSRNLEDMVPYERDMAMPAPTVDTKAGGAWTLDRRQTGAPTLNTSAVPAPTLTSAAVGKTVWTLTRPATTVAGDPRCWPPGHKVNGDDRRRLGAEEADERYGDRAGTESIKLSQRDGSILQGFPADYPWQGNKSKRWEQIGNAVPPPLAAACVRQVMA